MAVVGDTPKNQQDGRHQRAATNPGQSHDKASQRTGQCIRGIDHAGIKAVSRVAMKEGLSTSGLPYSNGWP